MAGHLGKEATVYVGDFDSMLVIAEELDERLGTVLLENDPDVHCRAFSQSRVLDSLPAGTPSSTSTSTLFATTSRHFPTPQKSWRVLMCGPIQNLASTADTAFR
jgi:hypothetical protein